MFSQTEIDRLLQAMRDTGVTVLEAESEHKTLQLHLEKTAERPAAMPELIGVKSPCIGHFQARGDDDGLAQLTSPLMVRPGDILGYISQGSVRIPVTAQTEGRFAGVPPSSGTIFGYGDDIFKLEPPR